MIEGYTTLDSFYMTVITLATVGFKEVHPLSDQGKIFTGVYIILNLIIFAYVVSVITTYIFEGELKYILRNYMTDRELKQLNNHVIVCGYGRNGRKASEELKHGKKPFVLIENKGELFDKLRQEDKLPVIKGDAIDEDILQMAGIKRAKAIITTLPKDADNVFIALTAKELNPDIKIIARASQEHSEKKLKMAGADKVIMPDAIGGIHMAQLITKPYVVEFLELLNGMGEPDLNLEEFSYDQFKSDYRGKTLEELNLRKITGATVIGLKEENESFTFNPSADTKIKKNTVFILLGNNKEMTAFRKEFT